MTIRRRLAEAALVLAALAAIADAPFRGASHIAAVTREIATEADHVDAITLAEWIRGGRPGLRVIDVRDRAAYDEYHIPTAESVPIAALASLRLARDETIVLYSAGGAHGAQAWVLLRAGGHRTIHFLSGGLDEWIDEVMQPRLPAVGAADPATVRALELSTYFGGSPRVGDGAVVGGGRARHPARASEAATAWRRGC